MSDKPQKKKIMIKRTGGKAKKPAITLNKPKDEESGDAPAEATQPDETTHTPAAKASEPTAKKVEESKPEEKEVKAEPKEAPKAKAETFKFFCVYCGQKLSASVEMVGKTISCPSCKQKIQVPTPP